MISRLAIFRLPVLAACTASSAGAQVAPHPDPADVEGALHWQAGAACRFLIDDCLDENGDAKNPLPEFTVSALECRPAGDRRAMCSFTSVKRFGPDSTGPRERCTGTLERRDHDSGGTSWTFVVPDPRRLPYGALLSCN